MISVCCCENSCLMSKISVEKSWMLSLYLKFNKSVSHVLNSAEQDPYLALVLSARLNINDSSGCYRFLYHQRLMLFWVTPYKELKHTVTALIGQFFDWLLNEPIRMLLKGAYDFPGIQLIWLCAVDQDIMLFMWSSELCWSFEYVFGCRPLAFDGQSRFTETKGLN